MSFEDTTAPAEQGPTADDLRSRIDTLDKEIQTLEGWAMGGEGTIEDVNRLDSLRKKREELLSALERAEGQ